MSDEETLDELQDIAVKLDALQRNLWPDNYAGGGTVHELVEQVKRLARLIAEVA